MVAGVACGDAGGVATGGTTGGTAAETAGATSTRGTVRIAAVPAARWLRIMLLGSERDVRGTPRGAHPRKP
ncbi:hypothetical protein GCM10010140_39630 [Streptosporangium pseudovulgare]|uniref:Uncharacterized protein n=1 Tax=Streptosporangium pseudovulgare TaxID=35765 RepID=A0ABQ2R1K6_9ACTN|nr:hypothetical protein GCM10010140_39630 [Streptosporangium pseudovulgare]